MSFTSYAAMKDHLLEIVEIPDDDSRTAAVDAFWARLQEQGQIPFCATDSVAFLYRGAAESVSFPGDHNGWEASWPQAQRLGLSDVWLTEDYFPVDARLDYKIVVDGRWQLDPANPHLQRSGFGDNSELAMPEYRPSPYVKRRADVPAGRLIPGRLESKALGYGVDYQVYEPAGYDALTDLPVLYITDGHEYADPAMGSLVQVLDNLIAMGRIRPLLAVFIDPRRDGQNLRGEQYVLNPAFVEFVAHELVPVIDTTYKTSDDRKNRGILGTSLGGLNSAWFAYKAPEAFYRIGIQSPAFQAGDGQIIAMYRAAPRLDVDIFMTWGTFNDFGPTTEKFKAVLDAKGYDYRYKIVNEGHSWGNWRALLDDLLIAFWPAG